MAEGAISMGCVVFCVGFTWRELGEEDTNLSAPFGLGITTMGFRIYFELIFLTVGITVNPFLWKALATAKHSAVGAYEWLCFKSSPIF